MFGLFKSKDKGWSQFDLETAHSFSEYTPDVAILSSKMSQLLFVCDHWQSRHWGFNMLEEYSVPLGTAFTRDPFFLFKRKLGAESWAVPLLDSEIKAPQTPIRGELHAITPSLRFCELDTARENGVIFYRERVHLVMPYQVEAWYKEGGMQRSEVRYQNIRAWMYIGMPDYWLPKIDEDFFLFDPVRVYEPKNPELQPYYSFNKLEYQD